MGVVHDFPSNTDNLPTVVVGNGPVGTHFVKELYRNGYQDPVLLFGEEPHAPYNRVQLSRVLAGSFGLEKLDLELQLKPNWQTHFHSKINQLDIENRLIHTSDGATCEFAKLILATGSRAHIPALPGTSLQGVFSFRSLRDTERLLSRQVSSRHTVVIGGGLLGIETARAMAKHHTRVTLLHHGATLMNRQLDEASSARIVEMLEAQGVNVVLSKAVAAVDGSRKVTGLLLRSAPAIECDTVIFATGIKPNLEIARDAGIHCGQGIRIDSSLQTNIKDIYAIGECAEYNNAIYGLVAPGLEQAGILAANLCDEQLKHQYLGSVLASSLKVVETPVFSMGEVGDTYEEANHHSYTHSTADHYRKIALRNGRLVGAIGVGDWPDLEQLKVAIQERKPLSFLRQKLFRSNGTLWTDQMDASKLPDSATICHCRQVSAGVIRECCKTATEFDSEFSESPVEQIGEACGAGTVCGSCQPLVAQFVGSPTEKLSSLRPLAGVSAFAIVLIALFLGIPGLPYADSYADFTLEALWTESYYRQISGFTMLGLLTLGLIVSLRKRLKFFQLGKFSLWRWIHVGLSILCMLILFLHTGAGPVQGLNQWLLISFFVAAVCGVMTAYLTHLERSEAGVLSKNFKRLFTSLHLVSFFPFPALLSAHIISVYWF